jgi:CheY-like chemotaxis protein
MTAAEGSLKGVQVLVVEDEAVISMILHEFLEDLGCVVIGPSHSLSEALSLARNAAIDVALIDVNLHTVEAFPVADVLAERGIPFVFMSGDGNINSKHHAGQPVLGKPFAMQEVPSALHSALGRASR